MTASCSHLNQPGVVSLTIEGVDERTVLDFAYALVLRNNVSGPGEPWRVPGRPGVSVQVYGHLEPAEEPELAAES
ncbi:hypothetical protein H1V43_39790 [Streptomyces sp. PSKA54]|uniref:Uncharacterized protein n=1 Tax=Streptomyces himalayensis subsp. aureolus TaxID=2758039 RepID=A0A7W2D9W5_9ACTN|nr:DUF6207 family protein [Streptomyces himalayensis]MBA4867307.1 hypothetical protein [Streptomyces himalayensis subsp. aureolus]